MITCPHKVLMLYPGIFDKLKEVNVSQYSQRTYLQGFLPSAQWQIWEL